VRRQIRVVENRQTLDGRQLPPIGRGHVDVKLDVQPTADAFETRAKVMQAMQGHVLGKAVYGGLFRRPAQ